MLIRTDSSRFLKILVEAFKKGRTNEIKIGDIVFKFVSAKSRSSMIFHDEIEVYEIKGIGEPKNVTELVVDIYGVFEKPVQLEIHDNYTAYFPQEDEKPIVELKEQVEREQFA